MSENKVSGYFIDSCLKISVTNLEEFNSLLQRVKKEALQLNTTIRELESFELNIEFSDGKN